MVSVTELTNMIHRFRGLYFLLLQHLFQVSEYRRELGHSSKRGFTYVQIWRTGEVKLLGKVRIFEKTSENEVKSKV